MRHNRWGVVIVFLLGRILLLSTLPLEGLRGYGDFIHYFQLTGLGLPFIDFWAEYPPLFPFLSGLLARATASQHAYEYLLIVILTMAQAGSLYIFSELTRRAYLPAESEWRVWVYAVILSTLPYGWWYFDSIVVFLMLVGFLCLLDAKITRSGIILAMGILAKLFPVLLVPVALKRLNWRTALRWIGVGLGITLLAYLMLGIISPEMTLASLKAQASKGSWGTVWALLDGNFNTGNFGPEIERLDASQASRLIGNPPRISTWLTLVIFMGLGAWFWLRARADTVVQAASLLGATWCIFLFWTPGYSPQWVLYLIPLILLALPELRAFGITFALIMIHLLEWPILLTRGYNWGLWLTISIRMVLLGLLLFEFYRLTRSDPADHPFREDLWTPAARP